MKPASPLILATVVVLCLPPAVTAGAAGTERVAVNSVATDDYETRKFPKDGPREESYVFFEGRYFGGSARDESIAQLSFRDLVTTLALDLAKQNYLPTKEHNTADLLIVVHWGTTLPAEIDPFIEDFLMEQTNAFFEELAAAEFPVYVGGLSEIEALNTTYQMSVDQAIARNARLLGYAETLNKERNRITISGMTNKEGQMRSDLMQERYFVILMAWDNQAMLKNNEMRLLWSTRFSMRAVGKNFTEALPALSRVAGNYFGRNLGDLRTARTHLGEGEVEMHDIEVLGTEKPSPGAASEQ